VAAVLNTREGAAREVLLVEGTPAEEIERVAKDLMLGTPRTVGEVEGALIKAATGGQASAKERFEAVMELAVAEYSPESAEALLRVACDRKADETTRDYAAMGLGNYSNEMSEETRKETEKGLLEALGSEKENAPSEIIRTLLWWGKAKAVAEMLGEKLKGHGMEIAVLEAMPGKEGTARLWELYEGCEKTAKAEPYDRRAHIGRAMVKHGDKRGIDILMELLPTGSAPGEQYRRNVYEFLARTLRQDFGYGEGNSSGELEEAGAKMTEWWKKNREGFKLQQEAGGVKMRE